jgi:hypothetical protein
MKKTIWTSTYIEGRATCDNLHYTIYRREVFGVTVVEVSLESLYNVCPPWVAEDIRSSWIDLEA